MGGILRVNIAGLDFFGHRGPLGITKDGFTGWDEGVSMRSSTVAKTNAHGSYALRSYQDSRTVSLSGVVVAKNIEDLALLRDQVTGVLADGTEGVIEVQRPWGVQWAKCFLADQTRFTEEGGRPRGTFQIQVFCPDAHKFGEEHLYVAGVDAPVDVFHWGNAPATPVITVAGSMPGGYRLKIGSRSVVVTQPLVSGKPHIVDYDDGRLRVGGVLVTGGITTMQLTLINPGAKLQFSVEPLTTGFATATMAMPDTFT